MNLCSEIKFVYKFLSNKDLFTTAAEIDIPLILRAEANFMIFINGELYFKEPISILEFYYVLHKWKITADQKMHSFNYYSIDYDESLYEDGAVLSLVLEGKTAQVTSIFGKVTNDIMFEAGYAVEQFMKLEEDLRIDIKKHFSYKASDLFVKASYI